MKHTRTRLSVAAFLVLFISACSQPQDVASPELEPQFGTVGADRANDVAVNSAHPYVYVAGYIASSEPNTIFLRRYNPDGSLSWERRTGPGYHALGGAGTDAAGNAYVAYDSNRTITDSSIRPSKTATLSKLSQDGSLLWRKELVAETPSVEVDVSAFVTDDMRNSYVMLWKSDSSQFRKYDTSGELLWQRDSAVFQDLAVGADGALYGTFSDSGDEFLTKYSASGVTVWQIPLMDDDNSLAFGGDAIYVGNDVTGEPTVTKYSTGGVRQWQQSKSQSGNEFKEYVSADTAGNVYLAATSKDQFDLTTYDYNLLVQKYTAAGEPSWTYNLNSPDTDVFGLDVDVRTADEVRGGPKK